MVKVAWKDCYHPLYVKGLGLQDFSILNDALLKICFSSGLSQGTLTSYFTDIDDTWIGRKPLRAIMFILPFGWVYGLIT